jgi:probable rRNA maturation factor
MYLGDIAFSFETIFKEAKEKKLIFLDHFKHLLLHSILHLIGYDHNNDEETEIMQNIEINILQQLSIKSPYL